MSTKEETAQGQLAAGDRSAGERARTRRDYTTGSVPKNLFHLAWPQAAEGIFNVADQLTDIVWAGRLEGGLRAIAGVGVVQAWGIFAVTFRSGLETALRAMVGRAIGGRELSRANQIALQAITLGVLYALLIGVLGIVLANPLMSLVGASADVRAASVVYMRLQFVFIAIISVRMVCGAALQGSGDPVTALRATMVGRGFHMVASPFFMFGWLGFPELGLAGASVANIIGQSCGLALNIYALLRGNTLLRLTLAGYRLDFGIWRRLLSIGYPASITGMERSLAQLVLLRFVAPFGDVAVAAFSVMRRVEIVGQFGSMGVGAASGTLVAQSLGAGKPERARTVVKWGVGYVIGAQLVVCTFLLLFPDVFMSLFSRNPAVAELGADWLRIQTFGFFFLGIATVFAQSYSTAGDTLPPMLVGMVAVWLIELPLALLLSYTFDLGPLGFAYATVVGMSVRLFVLVPYFFTNRWLRVKVL